MAHEAQREIDRLGLSERRLLYVAMTRAEDYLTLLLPQRFYVRQQGNNGNRHVYAVRSRFLSDSVCGHFQQETWPAAAAGEVAKTVSKGARTSIFKHY